MAIRIITSPNAFVRFSDQHLGDPDWYERPLPGHTIGYNLPVVARDDLAFQFILDADTEAEADAVCAIPLANTHINHFVGASLGPTITHADYLTAMGGAVADEDGIAVGMERYRLNDTQILYYFPRTTDVVVGAALAHGYCFQIGVILDVSADYAQAVSNIFQLRSNTDYTTVLEYTSEQDEAGFYYCVSPSIKTRVRLPIYLTRPLLPEEETEFRSSDGSSRITKAVVKEVYEVVTDQMPKWAALSLRAIWLHDDVITDQSAEVLQFLPYEGEVVKDGPFDIQWVDWMNYPFATVKFKVAASPFLFKKNNCGECADYSDMMTVTDATIGTAAPSTTYIVDLSTLVTTCCAPTAYSVYFYNTLKIASATISGSVLTIVTRASFVAGPPPIAFVRVKVTCGGIIKFLDITG